MDLGELIVDIIASSAMDQDVPAEVIAEVLDTSLARAHRILDGDEPLGRAEVVAACEYLEIDLAGRLVPSPLSFPYCP